MGVVMRQSLRWSPASKQTLENSFCCLKQPQLTRNSSMKGRGHCFLLCVFMALLFCVVTHAVPIAFTSSGVQNVTKEVTTQEDNDMLYGLLSGFASFVGLLMICCCCWWCCCRNNREDEVLPPLPPRMGS